MIRRGSVKIEDEMSVLESDKAEGGSQGREEPWKKEEFEEEGSSDYFGQIQPRNAPFAKKLQKDVYRSTEQQ